LGQIGLYVTTPFNMMKEAALNSPLGLLMPKSSGVYQGGAATRLSLTKMAAGTSMLMGLYEAAGQLHLTGSGDSMPPDQHKMRKEMGVPDNSIGFAGHYLSYDALGPLKPLINFAANMAEAHGAASLANKGKYWQQVTAAFSQVVNHGPLMHLMPDFFHMTSAAATGNFDEMKKYLEEISTTAIRPQVVSQIAQALDPVLRESQNNVQGIIKQDWPGYRAGLPLKLDHWGNPQYVPPTYERDEVPANPLQAFAYVFSPFHQTPMPHVDPVDKELLSIGAELKPVDDKMFIGSQGPQGLRADPDNPHVGVYYHPTDPVESERLKQRLEVLAGHEAKISGMNQHDYMQHVMNSEYYQSHNDFWRATKMEQIHNMYVWNARRQLEHEDEGLRQRVQERMQDRRQELRSGPSIGAP
jgi:hypothetical protein